MCDLAIIDESAVEKLLDWEEIFAALKQVLVGVSVAKLKDEEKPDDYADIRVVNPKRIFMPLASDKGVLLCMPGHVAGFNSGATLDSSLSCKILSIFNRSARAVPSISGYLFLFDDNDGKLKAVMGAERITEWRTAAISCIATELLWNRQGSGGRKVLAVFGAGAQGRIHAVALQKRFRFDQIRIWNRTGSKAEKLVDDLKKMNLGAEIKWCKEGIECAQGADVIVTATNATSVLVQDDWIKAGAHINAVGVGPVSEISPQLYKRADVYVEDSRLTQDETPDLIFNGELGQLLLAVIKKSQNADRVTVFQSRGMGAYDSVIGKIVYNKWLKNAK